MRKNLRSLLITGIVVSSINVLVGQCTVPSSVIATPSIVCSGATTTLNATSIGSSIKWYTVATSGVATGTSASSANFPITPVNTTTYYAEAYVSPVAGGSVVVNYTGGMQQLTIPAGVTQVTIAAAGAQGGSNAQGVAGGLGGSAAGILTVTPGDVLNIYVGATNGYNGGGIASNSACPTAMAGNGGGASDIRLNGVALANRVIVAGGGGGAGGNRVSGCGRGSGGGGGGGYYGGGGGAAWPQGSSQLPIGGDQVSGGIGGTSTYTAISPNSNGLTGALGIGGNGGSEEPSNQAGSASGAVGGVGGGLTGGNGVYSANFTGQSGAGGSSYVSALTSTNTTSGTHAGNGQIIIYGVSSLGCVSISRTPIQVIVNASPTLAISGSTLVCAGSTVNLTTSGAATYTWNTSANTSSISVTPTINTTYSVIGTSSVTGCVGSAIQTISVNALPKVSVVSSPSIICTGQSATVAVSATVSLAMLPMSYSYTPTIPLNGVISPSTTTTYTIIGTSATGCSVLTTVTQSVSSCTEINERKNNLNLIRLYPNPSTGIVNIEYVNGLTKIIQVVDVTGRIVMEEITSEDNIKLDISNFAGGIYYFKIQSNKITDYLKVVKQ